MRWFFVLTLIACEPKVSDHQAMCSHVSAMFEKCESFGGLTRLERSLTVDRWRGLCRAVMSGETRQLMPETRALFENMDDETRAGLREQAQCHAKAMTCVEYHACSAK
jgi:hypothetical protein